MNYQTIRLVIEGGVAFVTLNRPEEANGITLQMARELLDVAIGIDQNPDARAVLLTGAGKMFCAGGDLKGFSAAEEGMPAYVKQATAQLHAAISRFNWMDAPVVIGVNGVAAGGGMSLALCGDLVLASDRARFTMAYTKAGLAPDGGSSYFLSRLVGLRRAKELVLTNRMLSAEEAEAWGMVNRVVPHETLLEEATALASSLAQGPTGAFGEAKRLILSGATESLESQMERESRGIAAMLGTPDGKEGIAAFLEKRPPVFQGR